MKRVGVMLTTLLSIFCIPFVTHAALQVTEIMYNPPGTNTGRQWVEVINTGPDSVDLAAKNMRLFDSSGNHLIKSGGSGGTVLAPNAIAVIAQNLDAFKADWPSYTGMLLKSSFSLTSSGVVGFAKTDGTTLTSASYSSDSGAANDGNSLQQSQGAATGAGIGSVGRPTPGTYPATPPVAIVAPVKPLATKTSSTNRVSTSNTRSSSRKTTSSISRSSSSSAYDSGTAAPAASADAAAAGALSWPFTMPSFAAPSVAFLTQLASSIWFAAFLALVAFSSFLLLVIQRHYIL